MTLSKFSIIRCPVCGHRGKILRDTKEDETIACGVCMTNTKAARWECECQPAQPEEEEAKVRMELLERYFEIAKNRIDQEMQKVEGDGKSESFWNLSTGEFSIGGVLWRTEGLVVGMSRQWRPF